MALDNFFRGKAEDLGSSNEIICPECKQLTSMRMFCEYDVNDYFRLIIGKKSDVSFCVCPQCQTVFSVNLSSYGMQNQDLKDYNLKKLIGGKNV